MKRKLAFICLCVSLFLTASCASQQSGTTTTTPQKKKFVIAVIPKGATHEHWKSVHAGAIKASRELAATGTEVEVLWQGPIRER
ncbi:MAG: hypothetical protein WKF84_01890 [Pyrinomonadaceae bacterium]